MDPLASITALSQAQPPVESVGSTPAASNPISESFNLLSSAQTPDASASTVGTAEGPTTWGHTLQKMILDVNQQEETAGEKVRDVLRGGPTPMHEAVLATEKANISFTALATMRDKIVQAYQQIMQMQV